MHNDLAYEAWAVCGTQGQSEHLSPSKAGGCVPTVEVFEATAPVSGDEVSIQPDWALPHSVCMGRCCLNTKTLLLFCI